MGATARPVSSDVPQTLTVIRAHLTTIYHFVNFFPKRRLWRRCLGRSRIIPGVDHKAKGDFILHCLPVRGWPRRPKELYTGQDMPYRIQNKDVTSKTGMGGCRRGPRGLGRWAGADDEPRFTWHTQFRTHSGAHPHYTDHRTGRRT